MSRLHKKVAKEDGILLFIFSLIRTTNQKVVETCAGDGTDCMSANLIGGFYNFKGIDTGDSF